MWSVTGKQMRWSSGCLTSESGTIISLPNRTGFESFASSKRILSDKHCHLLTHSWLDMLWFYLVLVTLAESRISIKCVGILHSFHPPYSFFHYALMDKYVSHFNNSFVHSWFPYTFLNCLCLYGMSGQLTCKAPYYFVSVDGIFPSINAFPTGFLNIWG